MLGRRRACIALSSQCAKRRGTPAPSCAFDRSVRSARLKSPATTPEGAGSIENWKRFRLRPCRTSNGATSRSSEFQRSAARSRPRSRDSSTMRSAVGEPTGLPTSCITSGRRRRSVVTRVRQLMQTSPPRKRWAVRRPRARSRSRQQRFQALVVEQGDRRGVILSRGAEGPARSGVPCAGGLPAVVAADDEIVQARTYDSQ